MMKNLLLKLGLKNISEKNEEITLTEEYHYKKSWNKLSLVQKI